MFLCSVVVSLSGTGIYYQAIPAVGADGKNIMKLIPVQMVNGQFFQTDISKSRTVSTAQESVTMNTASAPVQLVEKAGLNPFDTQQIFRKQVFSLSRPVELDHGYSLNKHSVQNHTADLTAKVPPIATPATNCGKSVQRPCRVPVTIKSPALPKGHHILIPPNAQVQTVPASDLPAGIKKQICISSDSSSPGSSLQSVVYVSPVTTVNQGVAQTNDSAADSLTLLSDTPNKTLCGSQSKRPKPYLKLIPTVSQRPNSPIKWVIEEEDSSTAPDLNPLSYSSVTSEILRAMAEGETPSNHCDVEKTTSQSILSKSGQVQENALVMCNGKVFFLAKKCNLPFQMGQSDPPTSATKSYEFNRTTAPSAQQAFEPVVAQTQQDFRITVPDDVIDLCDDDDSTQQESSVDEDNVIFVSYIPPKARSASPRNAMLKSQMTRGKEPVKRGTSCSNSLTDEKRLNGRTGSNDRGEGSALRGMLVSKSVCGSAVSQQGAPTRQVESMEVDAETENRTAPSRSHSCSGRYSEKEKDTHNVEVRALLLLHYFGTLLCF